MNQKVNKTKYRNNDQQIKNQIPKMISNWTPATGYETFLFYVFFGIVFFKAPRASKGATMNDSGSQHDPQSFQDGDRDTPTDTENATQATDAIKKN